MVSAKKHVPIVKKRTKRFHRHQSDTYMCVDASMLPSSIEMIEADLK
jgi:hypothetical protein